MTIILAVLINIFSPNQERFELLVHHDLNKGETLELVAVKPGLSEFRKTKVYSSISDGDEIQFSGSIAHPNLYILELYSSKSELIYKSSPFLIDNEQQACYFSVQNDSVYIDNATMSDIYSSEYYSEMLILKENDEWLRSFSDSVRILENNPITDSLLSVISQITKVYEINRQRNRSNLHDELRDHYYSLWMIFQSLYIDGYDEKYLYFFEMLSEEIQQSEYENIYMTSLSIMTQLS